MKRFLVCILALTLLIGCLAGCGKPVEEQESAEKKTEVKEETKQKEEAEPASYDPNEEEYYVIDSNTDVADAFDTVWWNATDLCRLMLFDRLVQCDNEGNPNKPQLAKEFSVSDDGLVYTFVLRDDVSWHDGEAFTAEDVVWSVETALKATKISAAILGQLNMIEGAEEYAAGTADSVSGIAVDGYTVTFTLKQRSSLFMEAMSQFAPLPKHLLSESDPATIHSDSFWQAPVGTGCYQFDEFVVGEYFTFVRNDNYYGNKAVIKHVKSLICSAADYVTLAQANSLDYFQTRDVTTIEETLQNANYSGEVFPVVYSRQFSFNLKGYNGATDGDTKMADIRVRQALNYAIDTQTLLQTIYGDYATQVYTYVAPNVPGYTDDVEKYEYNPEKAKALLDEAGWDYDYTVRIIEYWGDPTTYDLLDMVVSYFNEIGVKAEYFNAGADATAALNEIRDYDINLNAYNCGASRGMTYATLLSTSAIQDGSPNDFDTLYADYNSAVSYEEQTAIYQTMQKTEAKYCYTIPLCTLKYYAMTNSAKLNTEGVAFLGDGFNYDRGFDTLSFNADYFA